MNRDLIVKRFVISTFVVLYILVSLISTIHVIDFFELSNPYWLAVTLAVGFELGAAASLSSLVILDRTNKTLVWALFGAITLMQMQGNMYFAFINLEDFSSWSELFGLDEEEPLYQKRVLAAVSGAILPLVALGFIKSLVDYIRPIGEDEVPSDAVLEAPEDDWDEDHAHDMVMGQMIEEIEKDEPDFVPTEESISMEQALEAKAQSDMQEFLKQKRGDSENTN
jgi:hypothetical protein